MLPASGDQPPDDARRLGVAAACCAWAPAERESQEDQGGVRRCALLQVSGIYPHLAVFNDIGGAQDNECGIGAVVPWAGRLWLITYPPHRRTGSPDKLYAIDERLQMTARPESVGGTHAGRMIHRSRSSSSSARTSSTTKGNVRAVDQTKNFPARITAVARHLTDPANKVYMVDMEGPIWEVDVHTLEADAALRQARARLAREGRLHESGTADRRQQRRAPHHRSRRTDVGSAGAPWSKGPEDAGALAEFDGKAWTIVSRRPYTDVTGPGGLRASRRRRAGVEHRLGQAIGAAAGTIATAGARIDCPRAATPTIRRTGGSPSGRGSAPSAKASCC